MNGKKALLEVYYFAKNSVFKTFFIGDGPNLLKSGFLVS